MTSGVPGRRVRRMSTERLRTTIIFALLSATALLAGGCRSLTHARTVEGLTIDGWRIGERIRCSSDDFYDCDELTDLAATQLDRIAPRG